MPNLSEISEKEKEKIEKQKTYRQKWEINSPTGGGLSQNI